MQTRRVMIELIITATKQAKLESPQLVELTPSELQQLANFIGQD